MKVSFDGKWFDPDKEEAALREAIHQRSESLVRTVEADALAPALVSLLDGATMIAVKLGATAAMHHAYAQPVDHEIVDVFAHTSNKLVGLNYVPPERIVQPGEEKSSGNQ